MSISSIASSALGPTTPLPPSTSELPLTPSRDSFSSPPDSLKQYRTAMKQHTTAAWAAALKDLKDHGDGAPRRLNSGYGFDENPFDRHALEYLSPTKVNKLPPTEQRSLSYQEAEEKLRLMLLGISPTTVPKSKPNSLEVPRREDESGMDVDMVGSASPSPSPSPASALLGLPADSPTPGSSNYMQTPFSASLNGAGPSRSRPMIRNMSWLKRESSYNLGGAGDTPGSTFSEASFEAISGDNYFSMYGYSTSTSATAGNAGSCAASSSKATVPALSGSTDKYSIMPPPPRPGLMARQSSGTTSGLGLALGGVDLNRASVASSTTITSLSSVSTMTAASSSTTISSTLAQTHAQAASLRAGRPSLMKPRPTPYPPSNPHTPRRGPARIPVGPEEEYGYADGDEGMEMVEEDYAEEMAAEEEEEDWIHGRSISEEMVARAGFRCQRGRGLLGRP